MTRLRSCTSRRSAYELDIATDINDARLLATTCTEARLPWAPDSPLEPRFSALEAYASDRAAALKPFSVRTLLEGSIPLDLLGLAADAAAGAGATSPARMYRS